MDTELDKDVIRYKAKRLLFFIRYMYLENHRRKFIPYRHLVQICDVLEAVVRGEITRLIINIPPRYGKTEVAVKMFIAWCLSFNRYCKFIHLSYSDDLALDNSSTAKEYIESEAFQTLWPMKLKKDAQGKKKWFNDDGGGVYATAAGGPVTGFGAGVADSPTFAGAIIIDDPLKPDDALSETKRKAVNKRYNTTIRSRVNDRRTPIIVIMQRLHENDFTGFLLEDQAKENWHHLKLAALDEDNVALCPEKHTFEELEALRQSSRYDFAGQYMQNPSPEEGGEFRKAWFPIIDRATVPESSVSWNMYIDGAYTESTKNDPTGIHIAGRWGNDYVILYAADRYLEFPALIREIPKIIEAVGVKIRMVYIEPKASGKSTAQTLKDTTKLNVREIDTDFVRESKMGRARGTTPYVEGGRVKLVRAPWNEAYLEQMAVFPNGKHDEHIDLTAYGVEKELILGLNDGTYSLG